VQAKGESHDDSSKHNRNGVVASHRSGQIADYRVSRDTAAKSRDDGEQKHAKKVELASDTDKKAAESKRASAHEVGYFENKFCFQSEP
jgi:hypothetical protein